MKFKLPSTVTSAISTTTFWVYFHTFTDVFTLTLTNRFQIKIPNTGKILEFHVPDTGGANLALLETTLNFTNYIGKWAVFIAKVHSTLKLAEYGAYAYNPATQLVGSPFKILFDSVTTLPFANAATTGN